MSALADRRKSMCGNTIVHARFLPDFGHQFAFITCVGDQPCCLSGEQDIHLVITEDVQTQAS